MAMDYNPFLYSMDYNPFLYSMDYNPFLYYNEQEEECESYELFVRS